MPTPYIDALNSLKRASVRKSEVYLPIAKLNGYVDALLTRDDLALRTSLTSPLGYDREITKLLHNHTEFVDETQTYKMPYIKFCQQLSNIDKLYLLWALYKSTYEVFENRKIKCNRDKCDGEITENINIDELIQEDTYKLWEHETPFYQYRKQIEILHSGIIWEFQTKLPTIADNNAILSEVSVDELQRNLQSIQTALTKSQQIALLTDSITITPEDRSSESVTTTAKTEIRMTCESYLPLLVSETFFEKYSKEFDNYVPKFYKTYKCPICGDTIDYVVDLELEFFRRSLLGREQSK